MGAVAASRFFRARSTNDRPQWKGVPPGGVTNGSGATAAPSPPSRRDRSAASRRCPSAAMAAWLPNGCPSAGVVTSTSGAGRSGTRRFAGIGFQQAVHLLEMHAVVDAQEEEPLAAAKAADEGVRHAATLALVAV